MKKNINISIFGLNLSTINELKAIIDNILGSDHSIFWTNIADTNLQVLIINHDFFDLPNIRKIKKDHLFILKVSNDLNLAGQIQEQNLYLPLTNQLPLKNWLVNTVLPALFSNSTTTYLLEDEHRNKIHYTHVQNILLQLKQEETKSKLLLLDGKTQIALIDPLAHAIWIDPNFKKNANEILQLVHADLNSIVHFRHKHTAQDLQSGLWQWIWDHLSRETPIYHGCYRLKYWPQPAVNVDRKNILKLSAYFQQGNSIEYIQQQLEINPDFIQRYLFVSSLLNLIEEISARKTQQYLNQNIDSKNLENLSNVRNFFSRLRKKLSI